MKFRAFVDLRDQRFEGNVLDVGLKNYGIVYNIFKLNSGVNNTEIDYVIGNDKKTRIEKKYYDSCVLFFSLSNMMFRNEKKSIINEVYTYMNDKGTLYIWDIDKGFNSVFEGQIKLRLPDYNIKRIHIKNINIFNNCSMESTVKLLQGYFKIIESRSWDGIYYIKAIKK